jgi:hypothetical protein
MKKLLLATTATLAFLATAGPSSAQDALDPLHGTVCTGTGTSCVNLDNGSFVPFTQSNFGFEISGPISPATGNLTLVFGVPTNEINTGTFNLPGLLDNASISVTTAVANGDRTTFFNSVTGSSLAGFVNLAGSFSPTDNFSNLSAGVIGVDPGFLGNFLVFTATINGVLLDAQGSTTLTNDFAFGSNLPAGTFIAGLFTITSGCDKNCDIGTAASSHLVVTPQVAVPGPIVGAGLPGLVAGCMTMLGLGRWRKRRNGLTTV